MNVNHDKLMAQVQTFAYSASEFSFKVSITSLIIHLIIYKVIILST